MGVFIRSQMGMLPTLVIALASLADGLVGFVTLGTFIGGFRHRASLWAARRIALRDFRKTLKDVSSICDAAERGEDVSERVAQLPA